MAAKKRLILSGFDVWGKNSYNSSWEILKGAGLDASDQWQYETVQLPVSWFQAPKLLESVIQSNVKAVICFGMTGGQKILVERIATNLIIPELIVVDNKPYDSEFVCKGGPAAYWSGLPVKDICSALQKQNIPCDENQWAGPHLCNFIFYWLMHFIAQQRPDIVGGFIHVPPFENAGGLKREEQYKALDTITKVVTEYIDKKV